jgi:membrane protein DedA with SNARE-associated domain
MDDLITFAEQSGYLVLFGLGFLEFAGFPIVTVPVLLAAGALAASGILDPVGVVAAVAAGGLVADAGWFGLGRRYGHRLTSVACGLSSNPNACVLQVARRVSAVGASYLLIAKFIPGAGSLVAPAAGLSGMRALRFLGLDAIALVLWAGLYTVLGMVAAEPVEAILRWLESRFRPVALAAVALILAAAVWRLVKIRVHRRAHPGRAPDKAEAPGTPPPAADRRGSAPDLREGEARKPASRRSA